MIQQYPRRKRLESLLKCTLPETNSSHLKMDGWNTSFLLRRPIFRGKFPVSFREVYVNFAPQRGPEGTPVPHFVRDSGSFCTSLNLPPFFWCVFWHI